MNSVFLIGRLTKDPVSKVTSEYTTLVVTYTLAVNSKDGAMFVRCTCFNEVGEFAEKYLKKGMKVAVQGALNITCFEDKDKGTTYMTEIIVRSHDFCDSKKMDDPAPAENKPKYQR